MSIKLLDTIYKLTDNADKVDGKHASDFAASGHTHNYAGSSSAGGAATSANKLATARTITLSGSVTGSTSFDGSGNVTISTTTNHGHSYASKVTVGSTAYNVSSNNITIPAYPTSLKCPNSLTIQGNGTSLGSYDGSAAKTINITPAAIGAAASSHTHSGYLPRLRMTNPDPGHANVGAIPHILALKSAGTPVYGDPEFKDGNNSVSVYNNLGNSTVTITRISDNQYSGNSSGYILQISSTTGTAQPGRGGFYQNISARAGAVFCQIFRAKIPTGFSVVNAENSMGTSYKTYWMTDTAGTGKWEWYCRITSCGTSGTMSGGGHVYLSGSGAVTWYLSYCNLIDLTKGNYDGLRAIYSDTATKLGSNAGSATNPIYFSGGKPVACTYSLNKTVPSDAKFTDTNTTYSAGTGISLSGTTFSNSGVRSIATGTSNGTISVNTNGTSANVAVKGLGSAAYTASTAYAAASHTHSYAASSHTHNYAGSSSPGGAATSALTISASAPQLAAAGESNNINIVNNANSSITTNSPENLAAITKAIRFRWYNDYWEIGSIRGGSSSSIGFGFTINNNNLRFRITSDAAYVGSSVVLHAGNWSSYCAAKSHTHSYAASNHNHDSVYSKLGHTHSYAASSHNHDSVYSKLGHTHLYAAFSHNHDSVYSKLGHTHTYYWANVSVSTSSSTTTSPTFGHVTIYATGTGISCHTSGTKSVAGHFQNAKCTSTLDSYATVKAVTSGSSYVGFYTNGKCRYASASSTSDRRLKKDIKYLTEYSDEYINKIDKIDFASFRYNDSKDENSFLYGFIAQDVQKYFPEIVDSSNEYLCLDYNSCFVLKIASLERKIKILEEKLKEVNILF